MCLFRKNEELNNYGVRILRVNTVMSRMRLLKKEQVYHCCLFFCCCCFCFCFFLGGGRGGGGGGLFFPGAGLLKQ